MWPKRDQKNRRKGVRARGFTLIEMAVAIAIMALLIGSVAVGFGSVLKAQLRQESNHLAATLRYLFDKATTTGKYYRLTIDLDQQSYNAEMSDEKFFLLRQKLVSKNGHGEEIKPPTPDETTGHLGNGLQLQGIDPS